METNNQGGLFRVRAHIRTNGSNGRGPKGSAPDWHRWWLTRRYSPEVGLPAPRREKNMTPITEQF
jgi:hypothetical protein